LLFYKRNRKINKIKCKYKSFNLLICYVLLIKSHPAPSHFLFKNKKHSVAPAPARPAGGRGRAGGGLGRVGDEKLILIFRSLEKLKYIIMIFYDFHT
jgi:hypothetical protein